MTPKKAATTALALAVPELGIPAAIAQPIIREGKDILTGDLAVVRVSYPRGTKRNPKPPIEVEYHLNLAALGIGAFFLALAAIGATIVINGTPWTAPLDIRKPTQRQDRPQGSGGILGGLVGGVSELFRLIGL